MEERRAPIETKFVMPDRESLRKMFSELGLIGQHEDTDRFVAFLLQDLAEKTRTVSGVCTTWEFAMNRSGLLNHPTETLNIIEGTFRDVVDVIIPDKNLANTAKELRRKMLREIS